jgi:hypothetical protein
MKVLFTKINYALLWNMPMEVRKNFNKGDLNKIIKAHIAEKKLMEENKVKNIPKS